MVNVAINGFGRIGRNTLRAAIREGIFDKINYVAINDPGLKPEDAARIFKYDSVMGKFDGEVEAYEEGIIVNGKKIKFYAEKDPANLPWRDLDIDVVFESTGLFTSEETAMAHINAGAKHVIISAPAKGDLKTVVYNVNHDILTGDEKIKSLDIINTPISSDKLLNLSIALTEYNSSNTSSINRNDNNFIDFSSISLLLKFGINTTTNNYYHLTADVDISAISVINLPFTLDVYIVVKDEYVKIYGVIDDAMISSLAQDYTPLFTKSIKSEFTFETYEDGDSNKEDGVGGYFHFKTTKVSRIGSSKTIKHYKTTSKNLIEGGDILTYLLEDFLLVRSSIMDLIGVVNLVDEAKEKDAGDFANIFTETGFSYDSTKTRWDIGLNLDELTGIDALKTLELSLYGSQ